MILIYQAYGREDVLRQTLFSITSLFSVLDQKSPLHVWVYTDNTKLYAEYFGDLVNGDSARIKLIEVTAQQIQKWRGTINFVHRVKIEVLMDAAPRFLGPIFYVDGDTYFRADPTALFSQVNDEYSLMHIAENSLGAGRDPLSKKIAKFVKKNLFVLDGSKLGDGKNDGQHPSEHVQMTSETVMWNAGALGVSQKNKSLLPRILALTDKMHSLYPKHVMEQLAFSHYLQTFTKVFSGDSVIGHYWDQKVLYQEAIDDFLIQNKNWRLAKTAYAHFVWPPPQVIKPASSSRVSSIFSFAWLLKLWKSPKALSPKLKSRHPK